MGFDKPINNEYIYLRFMKLVIVESPNKCHTISRYLGKDYEVMATVGHVRDLSTSGKGGFGVDLQNDFKPTYVVSSHKRKVVNELKVAARKAKDIYLATDPDREGEAIAWHLTQILDLPVETTKRLEFHEITRSSISEAIENPRTIDMNLVNSQETRRIIDRIIGFKLSNLIQKMIKSRSAGRVQSATLKLIADHDEEIAAFVPTPYWTLSLDIQVGKRKITANFDYFGSIKKLDDEQNVKEILSKLNEEVKVISVKKSVKSVESKPAFTTSTLQQEAYNTYKFSTSKTSSLAQKLYEGVEIKGEHTGLITYIRTDSTYLSDTFVNRAEAFIKETYGPQYCGHRKVVKVAGAQNAHEAIRPTSNHMTPESVKPYLSTDLYKLYKLIYERAVGSLMAPKKEAVQTILFDCGGVVFKVEGASTIFDGYTRLSSTDRSNDNVLPSLNEGETYNVEKVNNEQKMTEPPAHYTEARIVKLMEEKKIGRPSTYASTISTLLKRQYVESVKGSIISTDVGKRTSIVLNKYFPNFVDVKYTAQMENELDQIQEGKVSRSKTLNDFYSKFTKEVEKAYKVMYKDDDEFVGRQCPICGSPLVKKKSKYGEFVGCSKFPHCEYREKEEAELTGEKCPKCGRPLVYRVNKKNKKFIACSGYPHCEYIKNDIEQEEEHVHTGIICPECGGELVERHHGKKTFLGCSNFPKCHHIEPIKKKSK